MIYLDNAATSFPKAPGTAEAVTRFLLETGANAGRSSHKGAMEASSILFECREALAELFGIGESDRIIFTSNTTEALNTAIFGMITEGSTVLTSSMEHNSVMRPLRFLEKNRGIRILEFGSDRSGYPDMEDFRRLLGEKPDFLIITAASNVTGIISPFEEMAEEAAGRNIPVCVDGAQLAGHYPVNISDTKIDLFAFPGHKGLLGPTGTGGLYISERVNPVPLMFGGTGSRSSEEFQPDFLPDKYESGTPNIASIAGLLASVRFILKEGVERIRKKEEEITSFLTSDLQSVKGLSLVPSGQEHIKTPAVSVIHETLTVSEITRILDENDIAVRMGLHCAPSAHRTVGTFDNGGTIRFSPGFFTTEEEIEKTIDILKGITE